MKVLIVLAVLLILTQLALASNNTTPRIIIKIPNITINLTRVANITIWNQTRVSDILEVVNIDIYGILEERVNRAMNYLFNTMVDNIINAVPRMIEIILRGNTTD